MGNEPPDQDVLATVHRMVMWGEPKDEIIGVGVWTT